MPWSNDHVVLVASRTASGLRLLGTGTALGVRRVITARHAVLDEHGHVEPGLVVRPEGSSDTIDARVTWCGAGDIDVAVLAADLGARASPPPALLSARDLRAGETWEAQGYPAVRREAPSHALHKVGGTLRSCEHGESTLCLETPAPPEAWGGLSGAAVLAGPQVVGVVRAEPHGWDGRRLEATPVSSFLGDPAFRRALGLTKEDERLNGELHKLQARIAEHLRRFPSLAQALAEELRVGAPSDLEARVAEALLRAPGKDVALAFASVAFDEAEGRALLFQILPLALDTQAVLLQARAALAQGAGALELPLRTETLAELVLAGVDARAAQFAPGAVLPAGVARVELPAAMHAAMFDLRGDHLVDAVVMNLGAGGGVNVEQWSQLRDRFRNDRGAFVAAIDAALRNRARRDKLPHYMLVIDADLDADGTRDLSSLWAVVREACGKELPSLRLVRLVARDFGDELDVADNVRAVRDRRKTP